MSFGRSLRGLKTQSLFTLSINNAIDDDILNICNYLTSKGGSVSGIPPIVNSLAIHAAISSITFLPTVVVVRPSDGRLRVLALVLVLAGVFVLVLVLGAVLDPAVGSGSVGCEAISIGLGAAVVAVLVVGLSAGFVVRPPNAPPKLDIPNAPEPAVVGNLGAGACVAGA